MTPNPYNMPQHTDLPAFYLSIVCFIFMLVVIFGAAEPLWNEWSLKNPHLMYQADVEDLEKKLERAEDDFKEKRTAMREAEVKMNQLRDELTRAKGGK